MTIELSEYVIDAIANAVVKKMQEPYENAISRKADNLCDSCTNIGCEFQSGIVRTTCAFYMPPRIETDNCGNYVVQESKWIPVSERLPEKNVEVLVTTEWDCITIAEMFSNNDWFIYDGATATNIDDIKAWMPLPEPYKAESEE